MTKPSALAVPANLKTADTSLTLRVSNVDDLRRLAGMFAASGMFGATTEQNVAKCAIQLLAGMEAGFTPFASITGIYLINGRPGFSAQLLAQAIKRHPTYDYRVRQKTAEACRIEFFQGSDSLGEEEFTMAMAKRAGLAGGRGPWAQYPEAMLFARCLTAGMRTHCPDALGGHTPYTPEELGAKGQIDQFGMVEVEDVTPQPAGEPSRDELQATALRKLTDNGLTPDGIRSMLSELGGPECKALGQLDDAKLKRLAAAGASKATVDRWNAAAAEDDEAEVVEDELPLAWDQEEGAAT